MKLLWSLDVTGLNGPLKKHAVQYHRNIIKTLNRKKTSQKKQQEMILMLKFYYILTNLRIHLS